MALKIRVHERLNEPFNPKAVKIGDQVWMAENLAIDDGGEGIIKKNGETYYTWRAANRILEKTPGWHLPSNKEWFTLIDDAGGTFYAGSNLKKPPFNAQSNQDFWSSTSGSSATYFHFSNGNDVQPRQSVTSSGSFTTGRTEIPCLIRLIKD